MQSGYIIDASKTMIVRARRQRDVHKNRCKMLKYACDDYFDIYQDLNAEWEDELNDEIELWWEAWGNLNELEREWINKYFTN